MILPQLDHAPDSACIVILGSAAAWPAHGTSVGRLFWRQSQTQRSSSDAEKGAFSLHQTFLGDLKLIAGFLCAFQHPHEGL